MRTYLPSEMNGLINKLQPQRSVVAAAILATMLLAPAPSMAQSGIDSLGYGGSLGGDTPPVGTGIARVETDKPTGSLAADNQPAYYTLDGRSIKAPRRGEAYIVRWREQGAWRTKKVVKK